MFLSKLKAVIAVVLVLGYFVTGATVVTYRVAAGQSPTPAPPIGEKPAAAPPIAAVQDTESILEGSKAGDRKELVPGIAFRWCPPGKFKMGEGGDAIEVELSKGFWLGETEVTQGQWKNLVGTSPWSGRTGVGARAGTDTTPPKEGPDYAASYISYDDALSFCKKLTTQEQGAGRLPKSWKYSLPTEAQWEYACRAGTKTKFSFGDDVSQLSQYAWFGDNVDKVKEPYAHQVGLKKPNAWGLCDMHGNVCEWCNDWYASKRSGGKDPVGPTTSPPPGGPPVPVGPFTPPPPGDGTSGRNRVIRGGSWVDVALGCSSAIRGDYHPRLGNSVQGFRLAAVPAGQDDNKPMAEKPVDPAAKQENEKEAVTAWGKEVDGVQIGIQLGEPRFYTVGETVTLIVRIRNNGKKEVPYSNGDFNGGEYFLRNPPLITTADGKPVKIKRMRPFTLIQGNSIAPGKEADLTKLSLALRSLTDREKDEAWTLYGTGKFHVQYKDVTVVGEARPDSGELPLTTGKLELEIKSDPPPAAPEKKAPPKQDKVWTVEEALTQLPIEKITVEFEVGKAGKVWATGATLGAAFDKKQKDAYEPFTIYPAGLPADRFYVTIYKLNEARLKALGLSKADGFVGKKVRVTGQVDVTSRPARPNTTGRIIVWEPDQIEVLKEK